MAKFITSIDPGDHTVKIVVVKDNGRGAYPEIVTAIKQESHGFRKGNIVDPDDARESVRRAIARAEKIIGHPEKMHGAKLEGRILFVTCLTRQLNDLVEACDRAGVSIISTIPSPIAGSIVSLSKEQKYAGCALVDIGAETTKIAVYEDGMLHSIQTFDIGSQDRSEEH